MSSTNARDVIIKIATALAAALLPPFAIAQSTGMEQTLVTGTYAPLVPSDLTATISVLDFETIQSLNKRSVADILRTVPGVMVEEQGGPGGLSAVSIRGGEANFTLVQLDGVTVNDPTNTRGGGFDFSRLDPATVARIEIVRGPQSAIYGSDALAGVINILSVKGDSGHQQTLRAVAGEDDYSNYSASASGSLGSVGYAVDFATRDDGEPVPGSTRETEQAGVRLGWQATDDHFFNIDYRYLDGQRSAYPEQSGGPEFAVSDDLDVSDFRDQTYSAGWRADLSDRWRSALSASYHKHEEEYYSPGISPFMAVPPNGADTEFERQQLQWVNTLRHSDAYWFNLGADYRDEQGESRGYLDFGGFPVPTDFALDRSTSGLFIDGHARVIPELLLQGSARYDDPDGFSAETTLNFGARYTLSETTSFSANWGQAFKLPSFFALGHALVRNPDLQPELADSWDIGVNWVASDALRIEATYFSNEFEDLIDFDPQLFTNVNRKEVKTRGLELQLGWTPLTPLELQAQLTYTDIDIRDSSVRLMNRPEWLAGATALWHLAPDWSATLDYQWTGEQYASSLYTGKTVVETLDDYHRVDWNLRWRASDRLALELAIDNLLDEDYQTAVGFAAPGRAVRFGISWTNSSP
jgi:iron complex outermembrane receptor protein/vitamin B12 transporter